MTPKRTSTKKPSPEALERGRRARALRERRGLTQEAAAEKSAELSRDEIAKVENGHNQARTERMTNGLARAYDVPLPLIGPYLRGEKDLHEIISAGGFSGGHARYGNIEAALSYHDDDTWHAVTVATGKAMALCMSDDPSPPEWAEILNEIQGVLSSSGVLHRCDTGPKK